MTLAQNILARQSDRSRVHPGEIVYVNVETCVVIDQHFRPNSGWRWPIRLHDPDKVVVVFDHMPMGVDVGSAAGLRLGRQFVKRYGVQRFHDVGAGQGISHQVVSDRAYALPGTVLVCTDSHTLSAGALNCCARGVGRSEIHYVLCKGETWFRVSPTIRYELYGSLPTGVTAKDVFLHIAGKWGTHENHDIEFGGPGAANLSIDARRTLSTMCAEVSAEFALWEPDEKLIEHVRSRTERPFFPTWPDRDADYADIRRVDLSEMVPYVSGIDTVAHNTMPLSEFREKVKLDQCVVGSCANGTIEDLTAVAEIVRGQHVAPWVRFIVTPGSMEIYRQAAADGLLATIAASGALVGAGLRRARAR
jgi:3-isopropylmalate/(R)-2-methylmalate dehydratase large subunit